MSSRHENQCTLGFDLPKHEWLCIGGTEYQRAHAFRDSLADAVIFVDHANLRTVVVAELKGGREPDIDTAVLQVRGGTSLIPSLGWPAGTRFSFRPVILHAHAQRHKRWVLSLLADTRNRVVFEDRRRIIDYQDCGTRLSALVTATEL